MSVKKIAGTKRKKSYCLKTERSVGKFMTFSVEIVIFSEADSADMVFVYFLPTIVEDNHEHR